MKKYEYTGKTKEEAIEKATKELNVEEKNLIVNILEEKNTLLKKNVKIEVIDYNDLIDYIKEQPYILTIEAVQLLSNTLKDYLLKYPVTHEEHVENLKKRYNLVE